MNDAIKTKVTAPKLTEAQRRTLLLLARVQEASLNSVPSRVLKNLRAKDYIRSERRSAMFGDLYVITDAGRAALRGES
jgi:hypothetical protein